jgi:hypothetical protein
MKRYALAIAAVAATLLVTSCSSHGPVSKEGVATDEQMTKIDKVARAFAAEKYDDATAAGYKAFGAANAEKNLEYMEETRYDSKESFDRAKTAFDKGCYLVAYNVGNYGDIYSKMTCDNGDDPNLEIVVDKFSDNPFNIKAQNFKN